MIRSPDSTLPPMATILRLLGGVTLTAAAMIWMCGCSERAPSAKNKQVVAPAAEASATAAETSESAPPAQPAPAEHVNRLINEKSPYLLQHARNPVDWFPWGEEAFAKARRENKPIFLSVGYSTCYWCHVMEKESFEDREVATILNEHFVAIKVDREERPDVDEQYMLATQVVTQWGGWPNSVWLTPEGKPWMAGTYFPKPQFVSALTQLAEIWKSRRADVNKQADAIAVAIVEASAAPATGAVELTPKLVDQGVATVAGRFDARAGGMVGAPKFPPHGALELLIQRAQAGGDTAAADLAPITTTLDAIWLGGMHDHIGGGFHRYSTDARWLLPHFEKMLYDNAQLMRVYADGFRLTGRERYREAVADIFGWLQREMTSPEGAFYSALDSGEVGKEGEIYVWRVDQLTDVLGVDDAALFAEIYNFEKNGNFTEQSTGERPGTNIPHLTKPIENIARDRSIKPEALAARLAQMREKLLAIRQTWPQPHKDDKVLTSWNGLMIGALAHAGRALEEPRYTQAAVRAADFILRTMMRDGMLLHTYRDGEAKLPGYLDDYAYFTQGLIELHLATREQRWLDQASRFAQTLLAEFQDQPNGGFFFTTAGHEDLIMRSKSLGGGGNVPDANGVAAEVLVQLAALTGKAEYRTATKRTLESLAGLMERSPFSSEHLLLAATDYLGGDTWRDRLRPVRASDDTEVVSLGESAPDAAARADAVTIQAYASRLSVKPGESLRVAVAIDIDNGWHLYGENPEADFLIPTTVAIEPAAPLDVGNIQKPEAHRAMDPFVNQMLNTYKGRIWFHVPVTVNADAETGAVTLTLNVNTQTCDASRCLQPQTTTLRIPVQVDPDASSEKRHPAVFASSGASS